MMRLSVNVVLSAVLVSAFLLALCSAATYRVSSKPRTTRGFKNHALSTARGFGKRNEVSDFPDANELFGDKLEEKIPVSLFVEELMNNPELAHLVVQKFVDTDEDGQLTADEILRPLYLK